MLLNHTESDYVSNNLLTIDSVNKKFSDVEALKGVNLTLSRGEIVGLVGGNGAGKTTLLRLMSGLYKPSDGSIIFHSNEGDNPISEMRKYLGVVPESTGLYHRLTAWENIRYHSRLHGISDSDSWRNTISIASKLDFSDSLGRSTRGFSKGMRQKTALIRALAHDPEILLLDEPTSGLDVTSARMVRSLVQEMGREGKTIIYSTHKLSEAHQVCDRIIIIHNGEVRADGSPDELLGITDTKSLEEAYVSLTADASREDLKEDSEGKIARLWRKMMTPKSLPKEVGEDE